MRHFLYSSICLFASFFPVAHAATPAVEHEIVLIRHGETLDVTVSGKCLKITNKHSIAIGVETGAAAKWPDEFNGTHPRILVAPCD